MVLKPRLKQNEIFFIKEMSQTAYVSVEPIRRKESRVVDKMKEILQHSECSFLLHVYLKQWMGCGRALCEGKSTAEN